MATYRCINIIAGRSIVCFSHVSILGLRQAIPVSLAIWQLWELIQQNERFWDHVLGQELRSVLSQVFNADSGWGDISHKVLLLG